MTRATLCPVGELRFEVRDRDGALRNAGRTPNRVLAAGRAHVAASLAGEVRNQRLAVAVGKDASHADDDGLKGLRSPIATLDAEQTDLDGEKLVVKAAWVADAPQTFGESGVVLTFERSGARTKHELLYNRAVVEPAAEVAVGDTVTLTWTLSFSIQDA